jgi:uroporphyrin-III C-methyltransferase
MNAQPGHVYLVGAGPGDPDLLTVKAAGLLRTADFVLHDDLVPPAITALAGPHTMVLSVGKRCGTQRITQSQINARMVAFARAGNSVVRLKGGDPTVFGRLGEELDALRAANVPFEVVPGISSGFAAAALLRVSLTDRRTSSRIVIVSGHRANTRASADETVWEHLKSEETTLIVYMPGPDLRRIAERLARAGVSTEMPCVLVSCVSSSKQQAIRTSVGNLGALSSADAPAVLLIGRPLEKAAGSHSVDSILAGWDQVAWMEVPRIRPEHPGSPGA